jgi:hypothetical protein
MKEQAFPWDVVVNFGKLRERKATYHELLEYLIDEEKFASIQTILRNLMHSASTQYADKKAYYFAKRLFEIVRDETKYVWLLDLSD